LSPDKTLAGANEGESRDFIFSKAVWEPKGKMTGQLTILGHERKQGQYSALGLLSRKMPTAKCKLGMVSHRLHLLQAKREERKKITRHKQQK